MNRKSATRPGRPSEGQQLGKGRGPVHGAPAQSSCGEGQEAQKRSREGTRGEGFTHEETPRVLFFFFFPFHTLEKN